MDQQIGSVAVQDRQPGETEPRIEISKVRVTQVLVAMVVVLHVLNIPAVGFKYLWPEYWAWARHYVVLLSVSGEGKLPTLYSGLTMLAAAVLLGLIAAHERLRGRRFHSHWMWLGIVFALMAMDEMVAIHEMSSRPLREYLGIRSGPLYHAWVVPAMAFLAFMAVTYFRFLLALPARTRMLFVVAGAIYVGGALGMEMAGSAYAAAYGQDLVYGVLATLEEILEMSGMVLFLYGLMDHLEHYAPESRIRVHG